MAAYLESLPLVNYSSTTRSIAPLVLAASESDKDGQFWAKIEIYTFRHSGAIERAHWANLFAVMDSPCTQLECVRKAPPASLVAMQLEIINKRTKNDDVKIQAGGPNEQGDCT